MDQTKIDWCDVPASAGLPAFRIAKYPVTNDQYAAFAAFAGRPKWKAPADKGRHPAVNVSWYDAIKYCSWLSRGRTSSITLPTEAQWYQAATGGDGRAYPWGSTFDRAHCNVWDGCSFGAQGTTPVDRYPSGAAPCGALDMVGNVWEWCLDKYDEENSSDGASRVLRGGSWRSYEHYARCAVRDRDVPVSGYFNVGFRLCCAPIEMPTTESLDSGKTASAPRSLAKIDDDLIRALVAERAAALEAIHGGKEQAAEIARLQKDGPMVVRKDGSQCTMRRWTLEEIAELRAALLAAEKGAT